MDSQQTNGNDAVEKFAHGWRPCESSLSVMPRQQVDSVDNCSPSPYSPFGIKGKLHQVLQRGFLSDVTFLVGQDEVPIQAHKLILAFSSSVFEAMFYGPARDVSETIVVPDISPAAFTLILEYIYLRSVPSTMPLQTAIKAFNASRKYDLPDLEKSLLRHMLELVTVDSAATLLSVAKLFDLARLESKCWNSIELDTERFFAVEDFGYLDESLVKQIISRENLKTSELNIYNAVVDWARHECKREGIVDETCKLREKLKGILPLVRFPLMEASDFANGPAQSGILSADEIANVLLTKFATKQDKLSPLFSPKKRNFKVDHGGTVRCHCSQREYCLFCNPFRYLQQPKCNETLTQFEPDQSGNCVVAPRKRTGTVCLPSYCSCRTRGYCPDKRIY